MPLVAPGDVHTLEWLLRVAVAAEFIGHGAFGIITKAAWVPYFGVFGIPESWAWHLMPVIGTVDITLGLLTLCYPVRAVLLYMSGWGLLTATLRPLAGEGVWELLERGYNYGVPFAFLLLAGCPSTLRSWYTRVDDCVLTPPRRRQVALVLRLAISLALIGHGGAAAFTHEKWAVYFTPLGIDMGTVTALSLLQVVGWCEILFGLLVLARPVRGLLVFVLLWKVGTEGLRPLVGEPLWEFIERGGSYVAPLALLSLRGWPGCCKNWLH
jgi:hypothetical protein